MDKWTALEAELKARYGVCEDCAATPSSILLAVLNAVADVNRRAALPEAGGELDGLEGSSHRGWPYGHPTPAPSGAAALADECVRGLENWAAIVDNETSRLLLTRSASLLRQLGQGDAWRTDFPAMRSKDSKHPRLLQSDRVLVSLIDGSVTYDRAECFDGSKPFWFIHRDNVLAWSPFPAHVSASSPSHPAPVAGGGEGESFRMEVFPVASDDEPDAHGLRLHIGPQSFLIGSGPGLGDKDEVLWVAEQLAGALKSLRQSAPVAVTGEATAEGVEP